MRHMDEQVMVTEKPKVILRGERFCDECGKIFVHKSQVNLKENDDLICDECDEVWL